MKRIRLFFIFYVGTFAIFAGCGHILYADGPYQGKVIDSETKQPIEGAAVVAVWQKEAPALGHYTVSYYDAQDTLTDKAGNFTIPGITGGSANPFAKIRDPLFTIFKPGYNAYKQVLLPPVTEEGRRVVQLVPLKTSEDRKKNLYGLLPGGSCPGQFCVPKEKLFDLLRLMNVEESSLG